jgi:hypothetical protein
VVAAAAVASRDRAGTTAAAARSVAIAGKRERSGVTPGPFGRQVPPAGWIEGTEVGLEPTTADIERWRLLEELAAAEGRAWATRSCLELRQQGRSISGGWPGTLSQARLRTALCMNRRAQPDRALTSADMDLLARTVYRTAKAEWLAQAEPGSDE